MFKIAPPDTRYRHRVVVPMPTPEGGEELHSYTALFLLPDAGQLKAILTRDDSDIVVDVLLGWEDISDENGPLEFNIDNLNRLLQISRWCGATAKAFVNFTLGIQEKNSETPLATS